MLSSRSSILFIVGPTAVGKSQLAVALAQRFQGEVINADSRQVYRHMDIGTAKPTPEQRRQVPHHLLDIRDPSESFDLSSFLTLARDKIGDIHREGRLPVVVGGTGQYVWALLEGWQVPAVAPDPNFRSTKEQEAEQNGPLALWQQLKALDPLRAAKLDPRNVRRVIRALEIYHVTQRRPSDYGKRAFPQEQSLVLGLTLERQELYRRIDARVDRMVSEGLVEEVRRLADLGYRLAWGPLATPGYRELGQYLSGEISLAEAVQRTKFQTHQLARRQYCWFKLQDPRIYWLDAADLSVEEDAADLVGEFLRACASGTMAGHSRGRRRDEV